MKNKKSNSILNIETIIIIAIAACIIFLNGFTVNKLAELDRAGTEAMFIKDGLEYSESEQLGKEIVKYRPDSCKMIEMYDDSFELLFSLQFDETNPIHDNNINNHPELLELLRNNKEGQTSISIGDYDEEVYFQWVINDRDEQRLVIVYSTKQVVDGIWVFSFVCYLVLILVFFLLIRLHYKDYKEKVRQYAKTSGNFRYEVNSK